LVSIGLNISGVDLILQMELMTLIQYVIAWNWFLSDK